MSGLPGTTAIDVPHEPASERRASVEERLSIVRELIARREATGALLTTRRNFAWLTCGGINHVVLETETGEAPILVTPERSVVLTSIIEAARIADEEIAGLGLEVLPLPWHDRQAVLDAARLLGGELLVRDGDLEEDLVPIRSALARVEHARMAWLGHVTIQALVAALDQATQGETEHTIAAAAVGALNRVGVRVPVMLAAADERIERYRHPLPTTTTARRRLMLVLVAERWGLHVAATRIRDFEPPSDELASREAAVREVQAQMYEATVADATLGDVLAVAQRAYARAGFPDEWQLHHQGGTIGYQGRERVAVPDDPTVVRAGMAFAWNPSITGTKVEDTFILHADGARHVITGTSIDEPA